VSLEKKASMRLSQEPCVGVKVRTCQRAARQAKFGSPWRYERSDYRRSYGSPGEVLQLLEIGWGASFASDSWNGLLASLGAPHGDETTCFGTHA
jgi:hypothetical protein